MAEGVTDAEGEVEEVKTEVERIFLLMFQLMFYGCLMTIELRKMHEEI